MTEKRELTMFPEFEDELECENLYMEQDNGTVLVLPKFNDDEYGARYKKTIIHKNGRAFKTHSNGSRKGTTI